MGSASSARPRALLVDYGGVLTTPVVDAFTSFCAAEGLDPGEVGRVLARAYRDGGEGTAVARLERGEIGLERFAELVADEMAERLGRTVQAASLVEAVLGGVRPERRMLHGVERARRSGVPTALVSNSWGTDWYPWDLLDAAFDELVISGEVGLRKPDPRMLQLACRRLEVAPAACVFVDDIPRNAEVAVELGMTAVVHRDVDETLTRIAELLGLGSGALVS